VENFRRDDSNVQLSKQLAITLMAVVTALVLVITVLAAWISREHNQLSENGTKRMISSGVAALEESLQTLTLDHSLWAPAYEAIRAGDAPWIWKISALAPPPKWPPST
jgi:hypothetical protein